MIKKDTSLAFYNEKEQLFKPWVQAWVKLPLVQMLVVVANIQTTVILGFTAPRYTGEISATCAGPGQLGSDLPCGK